VPLPSPSEARQLTDALFSPTSSSTVIVQDDAILLQVSETTYELLRHFWSATKNKDRNKRQRMVKSLRKHKEKLQALEEEGKVFNARILHNSIDTALDYN
jgi:transcriptional regulator of NAD metabolism